MEKENLLKHHIRAILAFGLIMIFASLTLLWFKGETGPAPARRTTDANKHWTLYGSDKDGNHYYKIETAEKTSPGIVRVWTQLLYNPQGKKEYIEKRKKVGFSIEGYERFSHRNVLYELNCFSEKKELCIQEVYELTDDGRTLDYAKAGTYKDWSDVPAGSTYEQLFKTVCPEQRP